MSHVIAADTESLWAAQLPLGVRGSLWFRTPHLHPGDELPWR